MMYEMKGIRYAEGLLKFLLATAMAWLGCIALVSCDQGDTESENAEAHITLTLCLKGTDTDNNTRIGQSGGKQIASRGEEDEPKDPGTEMENSIDFSRFHVVFYQANQQMAGILQNMVLIHEGGNIYRLTGSLPVSNKVLVGNHFVGKMVVYANFDMSEADLQKDYNHTDIAQKTFDYEANPKYLPMWGVQKVDFTLAAGKRQDLSDIDLLRAVAKVKVYLSSEMKNNEWSIHSMQLFNYNNKGYCMPDKYTDCVQTASLKHEELEHFFNSIQTSGITMKDDVPIYLPEYQNKGKEDADKCVIKLKLNYKGNVERDDSGNEKEYTLRFIDYTDQGTEGTTTNDIVRDHYYIFEVYKGSNGQNLVKLTVKKWRVLNHEEIVM
ncbi:FimB/Mfa2 family fimbrial subunit [Prevotella copri]|uniref:FimB/Mfa2 family fimbrial subunit n=2 Tax=Segatella copri TaxID=165179 RepID=A0A6G1VQ50_9BACT|nr:FimB/Mfa2 family fimbrial subunit [Segatella copri]MQP15696.1 FimB/Mfa2 family fimbrial subunit [Segatella copri]